MSFALKKGLANFSFGGFSSLRIVLCISVFTLAPFLLAGQGLLPSGFVETDSARRAASSRWLKNEVMAISMLADEQITGNFGFVFTFSSNTEKLAGNSANSLVVTVKPQNARGMQGEWRLYRSFSTGRAEEIRIFPINNENVFVSIKPSSSDANKSFLSIEVYGIALSRNIPLAASIETFYTASLESISAMTASSAQWNIFLTGASSLYADSRRIAETIRQGLPNLFYAFDAAFDEEGRPVHIEDQSPQDAATIKAEGAIGGVNCSGFVKWIVDGIVRPTVGSGLLIEPLKTSTNNPGTHFTEPFRESRDVFFGLDWCRNLAAAVASLNAGRTILPSESGTDVSVSVFAGGNGYYKDAGYQMRELMPLMYWLAVHEPGYFYLAALSREQGNPPLRQFHHTAALFPYFEQDGTFAVAVFENAEETPISAFLEKNSNALIHLSRVQLPEPSRFLPQTEAFADTANR